LIISFSIFATFYIKHKKHREELVRYKASNNG